MRVGFLNNQIDNRGTGNALFDYAHYNETILGNESRIYTLSGAPIDPLMEAKIINRFGGFHYLNESFHDKSKWDLDVLYHIKYGNDVFNSYTLPGARYVVHAVFDVSYPHGDRFATISNWLARKQRPNPLRDPLTVPEVNVVPHILDIRSNHSRLRDSLSIPEDALVFGRHGGPDTFDIPWVWEAMETVLDNDPNIFFLFLGTEIPAYLNTRSRIISLPPVATEWQKAAFIGACDAMLHARMRGETFGISTGEFDILGKPVITYGSSGETAHIEMLDRPVLYFSKDGLIDILLNWKILNSLNLHSANLTSYKDCTPEKVIQIFEEVFLDE